MRSGFDVMWLRNMDESDKVKLKAAFAECMSCDE